MQTVAVFIQSVILQAFGTESGSFMRELPEAGDPWIKGKVERRWDLIMFFVHHRYIYWNAHFFGEDFYGWSIGDAQSLVESGPFHSQGIKAISNPISHL